MDTIVAHLIHHPVRLAATLSYATWRVITLGGLAMGLAFLAIVTIGIALLVIWKKVDSLHQTTEELSGQVGALTEKVSSMRSTMTGDD